MVGASPRTLSSRVRAQLSPSKLLLRTDRLHLGLITTTALMAAPQPGGGSVYVGVGAQDFPPDIRKLELKLGRLWERTCWDQKLVGRKQVLFNGVVSSGLCIGLQRTQEKGWSLLTGVCAQGGYRRRKASYRSWKKRVEIKVPLTLRLTSLWCPLNI